MPEFGRLGAQELAPCRRIEVEVGDAHGGAWSARGGLHLADAGAFGLEGRAALRLARARGERQARHRGNRSERFAAEAHGRDGLEVLERADLAGGMARERVAQVGFRDPLAVVLHLDAPRAALVERDADLGGARVQAVLEQFLQDGRRSLDHLAGRDLAHEKVRKQANRRHRESI